MFFFIFGYYAVDEIYILTMFEIPNLLVCLRRYYRIDSELTRKNFTLIFSKKLRVRGIHEFSEM